MDITPLVGSGQQIIQSYSGGRFKISGRAFDSAVIVFTDRTVIWDEAGSDVAAFAPFIGADVDVVLFGCGAVFAPLSPDMRRALKAAGLNVEVMDTGAACRTYNVLMAEGRRVAAALLPAV